MARRQAILEGTLAAQRLHVHLASRAAFDGGNLSRIDVFGAAVHQGATLLFQPLDGLLGAYLNEPVVPVPGIIVSTERPLHIQRFTAAHELGHLYMGHKPSFDEDVGLWRGEVKDLQEVAADAFASEFMLPRWLFVHHGRRQQWDSIALSKPEIAYQLSLRLGASYEATCWGLRGHKILQPPVVDKLLKHKPKALKHAALAGRATLKNSWADVWVITPADDGMTFEGGPDDVVIFRCPERPAAGYLWDEASLRDQGFEVLEDEREDATGDECSASIPLGRFRRVCPTHA